MIAPGLYFGSHADCHVYGHHRHPISGPQPHEYLVTVKAEVNIALSVDTDGTIRVRDASFGIGKDDINSAEIQDQQTFRQAELEGDLWDRLLDEVPRDGEIALGEGIDWSARQLPPVLDCDHDFENTYPMRECLNCGRVEEAPEPIYDEPGDA